MLANILGDSIKSKVLDKGRKVEAVESKTTPTMAVLNITAKNFITLPAIARDLNVARQAMITLVKLAGGQATNKADAHMLKESERAKKLEVKQGKSPTPEGEGGGLGGRVGKKIWKNLKRKLGRTKIGKAFRRMKIGIKKGLRKLKKFSIRLLKKIFNPKLLSKIFTPKTIGKILFKVLRVAGPIGLVITIGGAVVNGAIDAWNTWKETGSIWETMKAWLGGLWEFATFGLITKDTFDSLEESITDLLKPITEAFTQFKEDALEWIDDKWSSFVGWFTGEEKLKPKKKEPKQDKPTDNPDPKEDVKKFEKSVRELRAIRAQLLNDLQQLELEIQQLDSDLEHVEKTGQPAPTPAKTEQPKAVKKQKPTEAAKQTAPATKPTPAPAPAPAPAAKPSGESTAPTGGMKGMAGALAAEMEKYGISNIFAKQAIVATAAKESGLNPGAKESGYSAYLATLKKRGIEYIWKVFPQFKPGGRVAKALGYTEGVPQDYLLKTWTSEEAFFESVYGGLNTNPKPGDAYLYRGRGFVGITGRTVYRDTGKQVGVDLENNPDAVAQDFKTAASALAGYIFMVRKGKDNALKDLNQMPDFTTALKYTLRTVAGLGHKEEEFNKEGSHLQEQYRKASEFQSVATAATSPSPSVNGAQVAQDSKQVAQGQREQLKPTDVNVVNVEKTNNTKVAVNQTKTVDKNQGQAADKLATRAA